MHRKKLLAGAMTAAATGAAVIGISASAASSGSAPAPGSSVAATAAVATGAPTTTPIKHVVVLFDENISFDHYFGTYPYAQNRPGEQTFTAKSNTPQVNGLNNTLLEANPNAAEPQRLSPDQALTCDQNHNYTPEQQAFDGGLMDQFVKYTTGSGCTETNTPDNGSYGPNGIVMDYYDGNTVTALWNYAQNFTLSDNSYGTSFGPSTPGALNLVAGNTNGATAEGGTSTKVANGTMINDAEPYYDACSNASSTPSTTDLPGTTTPAPGGVTVSMSGNNVGNLLNDKGLTWGWFQGGFTPSKYDDNGRPVCGTAHNNIGGALVNDYSEHHEPFQYYASTANPMHVSPTDVSQIGTSAPVGVNHQYDLSWFNSAVKAGDMPAVSYLKAPQYEDGHAGYSDPLDEQRFLVDEINQIEQSPDWSSTAIFIAYDDSDGWYDHQMGPIIRQSQDVNDALNGPGKCGSGTTAPTQNDRCGVGPRLPLLVISPWAKSNYVDNTFSEQASVLKFIEDNWSLGRIGNQSADAASGSLLDDFDFDQAYGHAPAVILNDTTGQVEQTVQPAATTTTPTTSSTSTVSSTTSTVQSGGSGTGRGTTWGKSSAGGTTAGSQAPASHVRKVTLPRLAMTFRADAKQIRFVAHTKGGSQVLTSLRLRLTHGGALIANKAHQVTDDKATFVVRRGKKARGGKYTATFTIDAAGSVAAKTRTFSIR